MSNNTNKLNQSIDKAQAEAQSIQVKGVRSYLFERKISMKLVWFAVSLLSSFVLGAILAW
jgi:hypothetical protein